MSGSLSDLYSPHLQGDYPQEHGDKTKAWYAFDRFVVVLFCPLSHANKAVLQHDHVTVSKQTDAGCVVQGP